MRTLTRISLSLALVAVLALAPGTTSAQLEWCWNDPTLVVNGKTVHINLGAPVDRRTLINNSVVTVTVPENVDAHLSGANTLNFPMSVTLLRSGTWSGSGDIPVSVTGTVLITPGTPTGLKTRHSDTGELNQAFGVGGAVMALAIGVR